MSTGSQVPSESALLRVRQALVNLLAEGIKPTIVKVRKEGRVSSIAAQQVVDEWKASSESGDKEFPPIPSDFRLRIERLWQGAVVAAREEFSEKLTEWELRVAAVELERDEAIARLHETVDPRHKLTQAEKKEIDIKDILRVIGGFADNGIAFTRHAFRSGNADDIEAAWNLFRKGGLDERIGPLKVSFSEEVLAELWAIVAANLGMSKTPQLKFLR